MPASSAHSSTAFHRELTDADLDKIVGTYHAWRGTRAPPKAAVGV